MPRGSYNSQKNRRFQYHRSYNDLDDDREQTDYIPRQIIRNERNSGKHSMHRYSHNVANPDTVRRVMGGDNFHRSPTAYPGCGLGSGESWVRITVVQGATLSLDFVKESFGAAFGLPIRIYNAFTQLQNLRFCVKVRSKQIATYRKAVTSIIDPNTGKPLICDLTIVREPDVPPREGDATTLPIHWVDALRQCFLERFQTTTRTLDLSSLHTDPTLLSKGFYMPLYRTPVFTTFLSILQENNAQLASLSLSNNKLNHVQPFANVSDSQPPSYSIAKLDLSDNFICSTNGLNPLRHVPGLVDLDITETPLYSSLSNPDKAKIMNLRISQAIPGLKILNGVPVKNQVAFAIEQNNNAPNRISHIPLPASIQGYFPNDEVRIPLLTFLKEYFARYDSNPRGENVLSYYTSPSIFTFCLNPLNRVGGKSATEFIEGTSVTGSKKIMLTTGNLDDVYFKNNRNLLRCRDEGKRRELVCKGPLAIASALSKFPVTEHVLESFCIDVIFHSGNQILFKVSGVFFEVRPPPNTNSYPRKILRCFARSMILVAPGGNIIQDDLIVSNPTDSLIQRYIRDAKKQSHVLVSSQPTVPSIDVSGMASSSSSIVNNRDTLLLEFRRQTGMNNSFALQCLDEFRWDFQNALSSFQVMNSAGRIPQSAFTPD